MKQFSCGDVVPGCKATWERQDEREILSAVAAHAFHAHGLLDVPPELIAAVRANIRSVAA